MRYIKLVVVCLLGLSILSVVAFNYFNYQPQQTVIASTPSSVNSDKLFQLVNEWRTENGYQTYLSDSRLCKIASDRADDFDYSHRGFIEKYSNYPYIIQENIVWNYSDEKSSLNGWLHSPGHLGLLKEPYKYSCVACVDHYCSEIFSSFKTDRTSPY